MRKTHNPQRAPRCGLCLYSFEARYIEFDCSCSQKRGFTVFFEICLHEQCVLAVAAFFTFVGEDWTELNRIFRREDFYIIERV